MPIIGSYILPHPPFCVPEVGRGKEKAAAKTVEALNNVAKEISSLKPDTIVFVSPHSEAYRDFFPIADGEVGICNFSAYGKASTSVSSMTVSSSKRSLMPQHKETYPPVLLAETTTHLITEL